MQPENTTFSPRQSAILNSLASGATRSDAATAAGISRRTLYNWMDQDPSFREAVQDAEEECIDIARGLAFACAMRAAEDPRYLRALFFYLKCKAGWTDRPPAPSPASANTAPLLDTSELIQQITTEVIHTLQSLSVISPTPPQAEPAESPAQNVQSVQPPTKQTDGSVGASGRSPSSPDRPPASPAPSSPNADSDTEQPTTDHGQLTTDESVQSVQPPPSSEDVNTRTPEHVNTSTQSAQSVQQPAPESTRARQSRATDASKIQNQKSKMSQAVAPAKSTKPARPQQPLSSKKKDAQRLRAFRNKLHR